jgi:hypothetical protein
LTNACRWDENPPPKEAQYLRRGGNEVDGLESNQLKQLTSACLQGNSEARRTFQDLFAQSIYDYPAKAFRVPRDKLADFFIYAFDGDKIFKRLGSFEGRNEAHFQTYLRFYVLRDLFREWQRSLNEIETISWDSMGTDNKTGEEAVFNKRNLSMK